jgi:hypothetical protein
MYLGDDEILGDDDDEMGADEILAAELGDDLDEILGADRGRGRRGSLALARRVALARAAGGAVVSQRRKRDAQEQVLPFPATPVLAAANATILAFPQRTFRTERFLVSSTIAEFFDILDLRIGRESMMVANGAAPAQGFSEVGVGVRLRGYTANLGNTVGLDVINIDPALPHTFRAMIIGTAVF